MYRNSGCRLALMSALGLSLIGLLVGSPLWGDGGDPKKGEYWYHEAGCVNCHGEKGEG